MLRRELNELLEDNPKLEGKITWSEALNKFSQINKLIIDWKVRPQYHIANIKDYNSFIEFKKEWVNVYKQIYMLPYLYNIINTYKSQINEYNKSIIAYDNKKYKLLDIPYTYNEKEFSNLYDLDNCMSEYAKGQYNFINSLEFKEKIFKHTIAVLSKEDSERLVNEKQISTDTLKVLPSLIAPIEVYCGSTKSKKAAEQFKETASINYHDNLSNLYKYIGLELPDATEIITKLKGVTFDGRQNHLADLYDNNNDYTQIPLIAERKYFNGEPCIQIYAMVGTEKIDIGFLDKTIANDIEMNYNNPNVSVRFDKLECLEQNSKKLYYANLYVLVSPEAEKVKENTIEEDKDNVLETE